MNLAELRAQARAVATRMEARITTALGGNREMTAEETAGNAADEAELAAINGKIQSAEAAEAAQPDHAAALEAAGAAATTAERARVLALVDLCPSSAMSEPLRAAVESGEEPGAFAIGLAKGAKERGASVEDLRRGAAQAGQLPQGGPAKLDQTKAGTIERGRAIAARAASLGHSALSHLKPAG